jgi:hypothetical protein
VAVNAVGGAKTQTEEAKEPGSSPLHSPSRSPACHGRGMLAVRLWASRTVLCLRSD